MKRVGFYLFWAQDGHADDYVAHCLEGLSEHVESLVLVSNGPLDEASREHLAPVVDEIIERENVGYDVGGYREALATFGAARLRDYDELILLNYTFFGPVGSYADVFERSESWDVDFWGLTDHGEMRPHPFAAKQVLPNHIQSHWIAVRRTMFDSEAFREYWHTMPLITSYNDSVEHHESRFTEHFADRGYRYEVAFPARDYPTPHPAVDTPALLLDAGCPIVKRRLFFHDPLYMNDHAIIGRDVTVRMAASAYPMRLVWQNISHTAQPRIAATNVTMSHVLPDVATGSGRGSHLTVAVVMHVFYETMIDELMGWADHLPRGYDLFITTTDDVKKAEIEARLTKRGREQFDVRVVASNRGRDITAFLLGCRDVLLDPRYDLVLKLHSKKSAQDGYGPGDWFKRHLFENLLSSPGYAQNILDLFADDESLGMVFPPVVQIGYPTLGKAWYHNKQPAIELCRQLGINVAFDADTPVSPYGSMFFARPAALRPLLDADFDWADFPTEGEYGDGSLAHVVERLFSYAAMSEKYVVNTVLNTTNAAINYGFLEYKLAALSSRLPGTISEQYSYLNAITGLPNVLSVMKQSTALRHPRLAAAARPAYRTLRNAVHGPRRVVASLRRSLSKRNGSTAA